jgi:hypothetical protein
VPDIHHDHGADLIAREDMSASQAAEGDREIGSGGAVGRALGEVDSGGPVQGHDRNAEVVESCREIGSRLPGAPFSSRAENGVDGKPCAGPRAFGIDDPNPLGPSEFGHADLQLGAGTGEGGDPHRNAGPIKGAGNNPAVASIVPGAGGDDHTAWQVAAVPGDDDGRGCTRQVAAVPGDDDGRGCTASAFHQRDG